MTNTNRSALGKTTNTTTDGVGMDKFVQTLLNGYQLPAVLSNATNGDIIYSNDAVQRKLGLSSQQLSGTKLQDHFSSRRVIQQTTVWKYRQQHFEISEEKISLSDKTYIKSVLKPLEQDRFLDLLEMQKETAKLLVHRFHSPLNGVTGFTELLKETDLTEKQLRYLKSIEEGLGDFADILSSVHELAKDIEVQYSTINLSEFAKEIVAEYPPENRKNINLVFEDDTVEIKSDFLLLKAVIKELLDNALEHSSGPQRMVYLQFRKNNIRVTNCGSQIPKSFAQKMFYPFFSNKARSLGLGLSKCVLYATKLGYEVVLAENSGTDGISFDIKMQ